jgi:hypothetical protein
MIQLSRLARAGLDPDVVAFLARGSLGYAKSCVKNVAKVALGRSPYFTYQDNFFRLYLRQAVGITPIRKITCVGFTREGAGSQALMIMNAIAVARATGLTYLHTPFAEIGHAERPMQQWVAEWESHFNLGLGEPVASADDRDVVSFAQNFTDMRRLFGIADPVAALATVVPELRRKYRANKRPRTQQNFTVCIHIRRGDVTLDRYPNTYTPTSLIANTLAVIRAQLERRRLAYRVCVLSQGAPGDFAELVAPDTDFFLDADPIWSMQQAIDADVFIMAKSSFSYVAALLSEGIKICAPDGYAPMPEWLVSGPHGELDGAVFGRMLTLHLDTK